MTQEDIANGAHAACLEAAKRFDRDILCVDLDDPARQWWAETFELHVEGLAERIRKQLLGATLEADGCLTHTPGPRKISWRGHRQRVYQLVAYGTAGRAPSRQDVVRHLCHNRGCINPNHLRIGSQRENIGDERIRRGLKWAHLG